MVTPTASRPPLRLTRRGRLAVLLLFLVLASFSSAVLFTTASRADGVEGPAGPAPADGVPAAREVRADVLRSGPVPAGFRVVVVRSHDTLWAIASRHARGRDPWDTVAEIRRWNGMPDSVVHPGQRLLVPGE
ncbi:LysM peptidoglycan-binding domain-containing protein [Mangrovihabitans endophyticus]|nr:LysM peptidoglycan-binding domain-containing protein [Mangrovihabitans endophyticus]